MIKQKSLKLIVVTTFLVVVFYVCHSESSYADPPDYNSGLKDDISSNDEYLSLSQCSNECFDNEHDKLNNYFNQFVNDVKTEYNEFIENDIDTNRHPLYPTTKGIYLVKEGMPKNTRHLKEGYWIGALPSVENIIPMYNHGIRVILTVTKTKNSWNIVKSKIDELGIEHIYMPIGSKFPSNTSIYERLLKYNPNEIFVHCDHGGDRSGTVIAYLLVRRNHWTPEKALAAMLNPSGVDLKGLREVLNIKGYNLSEDYIDLLGIYSGKCNGGFGGLKVRNEDYKRLVSTMLDVVAL